MGYILDCETETTTEASLAMAYRCNPEDIYRIFDSLDLNAIYESEESPTEKPGSFLSGQLCAALSEPELPEWICWFHFTRTSLSNDFGEGILPLGKVLSRLWVQLIRTAPSSEVSKNLQALRENGVPDFQYRLKAPCSMHWGPFGYLVPAIAEHAKELAQHDYLGMPEIIEDICNGYFESFGVQLYEHYGKLLKPCIVKFQQLAGDRGEDALEVACSYLYGCRKKERPSSSWITCFDGEGSVVPANSIISVRYIESSQNQTSTT